MVVVEKDYKGAAETLYVSGSINGSVTTFTVKTTPSGSWPTGSSLPFVVTLDIGEPNEETILCTSRSGSNFTVTTRGYGGTAAAGHSDNATVEHTTDAVALADMIHAAANTTGKVTTAGDMLVASGSAAFSRLAKGSNGQLLTVTSGTVGWGALPDSSISATTQFGTAVVPTAALANDAVTYAKMQNVSVTDRLLGRDTAGAGDTEELSVGGGVEFTGSGGIQRSALTGDVTATAGSNATQIAASVAGNGLTGGGGSALAVNPDNVTIEINTDAVRVKAASLGQTYPTSGLTFLKGAAGAPSGTTERMWYDTTNNLLYVRNSSDDWVCVTPKSAETLSSSTRSNTAYGDLGDGSLPTLSIVTSTKAVVDIAANMSNATSGSGICVGFAVSGASTIAATDTHCINSSGETGTESHSIGARYYVTGLTAGTNTFTMKYRSVTSGTITVTNRSLTVTGLP